MISLACVLLASFGVGVLDSPPKDAPPKPLKVGTVIDAFGLDESKVAHIDEPPGKLCELRWQKVKLPGTTAEVDVAIRLTDKWFSHKRDWDMKRVRTMHVARVMITPPER